jgi:hypothetical protein
MVDSKLNIDLSCIMHLTSPTAERFDVVGNKHLQKFVLLSPLKTLTQSSVGVAGRQTL